MKEGEERIWAQLSMAKLCRVHEPVMAIELFDTAIDIVESFDCEKLRDPFKMVSRAVEWVELIDEEKAAEAYERIIDIARKEQPLLSMQNEVLGKLDAGRMLRFIETPSIVIDTFSLNKEAALMFANSILKHYPDSASTIADQVRCLLVPNQNEY